MATFTPKPQPSVYESIRHVHVVAFPGEFAGSEDAAWCVVSASPLADAARAALIASAKTLGYRELQLAFLALASVSTAETMSDSDGADNQNGSVTTGAADVDADSTSNTTSSNTKPAQLLDVLEALDPLCVVLTDHESVAAASRGYNRPLSLETKEQLLGRPCRCFEDFAELLTTEEGKRRAWSVLKTLPHA